MNLGSKGATGMESSAWPDEPGRYALARTGVNSTALGPPTAIVPVASQRPAG
jgi:hypothetical protein